ncbi:Uncharacterized protein Fot_28994 [Forsythia ovata]|uniref:Uncharacterized protein n=1 Tax=Forsythia ovata TaxID=205694 RepID=A0ABD1TQK9_9LAMI
MTQKGNTFKGHQKKKSVPPKHHGNPSEARKSKIVRTHHQIETRRWRPTQCPNQSLQPSIYLPLARLSPLNTAKPGSETVTTRHQYVDESQDGRLPFRQSSSESRSVAYWWAAYSAHLLRCQQVDRP